MTLDELNERADELGITGDQPIIIHEPGVGFWTIEALDLTRWGEARLVIQESFDTERG